MLNKTRTTNPDSITGTRTPIGKNLFRARPDRPSAFYWIVSVTLFWLLDEGYTHIPHYTDSLKKKKINSIRILVCDKNPAVGKAVMRELGEREFRNWTLWKKYSFVCNIDRTETGVTFDSSIGELSSPTESPDSYYRITVPQILSNFLRLLYQYDGWKKI